MVALNARAAQDALAAGVVAATDVTGFGLLGHLFKMARASGVSAVVDAAAVPYLDGAREALRDGFVSGGTRRNLDWVRPHLDAGVDEDELLLLADAQTSGGLLVVGEVPGAPVVGEVVARGTRSSASAEPSRRDRRGPARPGVTRGARLHGVAPRSGSGGQGSSVRFVPSRWTLVVCRRVSAALVRVSRGRRGYRLLVPVIDQR